MALIVEDGTGKTNADSYVSVTDADTYFANRGITTWATLQTVEKEQALRRATDYMLEVYRLRWDGYRWTPTQALDWPRVEVRRKDAGSWTYFGEYYDYNVVPAEIPRACCELALRAAAGELSSDLEAPKVREKVGPLETEWAVGQRQSVKYTAVENLLAPFFGGSGNSMKVGRA